MSCMQRGLHVIRVLIPRHTHWAVRARSGCQRAGADCAAGWTAHALARRAAVSSGAGSAAALGGCELEPLLAERPPRASALHAYQTKLCTVRCFGCKRVPAVSAVNGWLL